MNMFKFTITGQVYTLYSIPMYKAYTVCRLLITSTPHLSLPLCKKMLERRNPYKGPGTVLIL